MKKILFLILFISFNAHAERQTVFNDDNYIPKEIDNILPSKHIPKTKTANKRKKRQVWTSSPIAWQYNAGTASSPKMYKGTFTYKTVNGSIDTNSICKYKHGSIMQRNCRKAAIKYFKKKCSPGFKNACIAANMRP